MSTRIFHDLRVSVLALALLAGCSGESTVEPTPVEPLTGMWTLVEADGQPLPFTESIERPGYYGATLIAGTIRFADPDAPFNPTVPVMDSRIEICIRQVSAGVARYDWRRDDFSFIDHSDDVTTRFVEILPGGFQSDTAMVEGDRLVLHGYAGSEANSLTFARTARVPGALPSCPP